MILDDFLLLLGNTTRSRAYLQVMLRNNYIPAKCLLFVDKAESLNSQCVSREFGHDADRYFNEKETLLETLERYGVSYEILENKDINAMAMKEALKNFPQKYIIYSGYGGAILKNHLFAIGKKFIHIHAGILPQYRGSTTAYYSMLNEGKIGATAIFMNAGIDSGDIIAKGIFTLPKENVDIDYIYEPYVRANVLVAALEQFCADSQFTVIEQNENESETYYIIHPVLKHIALLRWRQGI